MVDKALKDMTFEDFCRSVFNIKDTFHKPEVLKGSVPSPPPSTSSAPPARRTSPSWAPR